MTEYGDKVSDSDKAEIRKAVDKLKKSLETSNVDEIKQDIENLNSASHKISEILYKQASADQAQAAGGGMGPDSSSEKTDASSKGEEVVDAEYEVEDEKK
jgi:molecular chaperone DnaK